MGKNVTLHEEIRDILESQGNRWMTTSELASRVNFRGRYLPSPASNCFCVPLRRHPSF